MIAVCGVAVATMAAVCVMSVFGGFQGLVADMFSAFDPELKITPAKGKVFSVQENQNILQIYSLSEVEFIAETLEDNALLKYQERQIPVTLKGVDQNFEKITKIQDILFDGEYKLREGDIDYSVLGIIAASNLGVYSGTLHPLEIYVPRRGVQIYLPNPLSSFNIESSYVGGLFMVEQEQYDENYMLVSIDFARELFAYQGEVSALEIKLKEGANISSVKKKIQNIIGDQFVVKDRYEQQETTFKMMQIEKWISFLMVCFIILIAAFNIIGLLSILMVDKQKDINTLRNLGANNTLISRIFLFEGWLISGLGAVAGVVLGVLLCWGQSHYGWIKLGTIDSTFAISAYPVVVNFADVALIFLSVLIIGFLAVLYPVHYLSKKLL